MLTVFFVTFCRTFDEKNDVDNQGDDKKSLNTWGNGIYNADKEKHGINNQIPLNKLKSEFTDTELDALRLKQAKMKKCQTILREIFFNFLFIFVLFCVCYTNKSQQLFNYQHQISNTFASYQHVTSS